MVGWRPQSSFEVTINSAVQRTGYLPDLKLAAPGNIWHYQFVNDQRRAMLALWSAEVADGDKPHRRADVELAGGKADTLRAIQALDLMDGSSRNVPFERSEGRVMLTNFVVPDYPVLLIMQ
jgi:hypothetical protein